ncbi:hypothetical protein [Hephaestia mangrovi]|uniref:hypothetical protein n=1 Tax=Hephaestia mangrovi TaxID=2873268 RepID=UPI001CA798B1|nr:hypothetical protein [Hephaestia mangrovi]MBY8829919.1 hypothetical protein [Hephaestia mangrovi]
MFLNLALAFLHARGLPASTRLVIVAQVIVTALALPAFTSPRAKLERQTVMALCLIALSLVGTNIANPFNPKTIYDTLLIPIYIILGMAAGSVRTKWMHGLLLFVLATTLMEAFFPALYVRLFDPAAYFSATREWIANQDPNASTDAGFYAGAFRAGGSQFGFADHRLSGAFMEPLSLGYFSALMSIYYAGIYRGPTLVRAGAIIICMGLALAADSRAGMILIVLISLFLLLRIRAYSFMLWLIGPMVIVAAYIVYTTHFGDFYRDTVSRLEITFGALDRTSVREMLLGAVPLDRVGDSGVIYMLRCVGLLGMPVAIWFYSGIFTRWHRVNTGILTMVTVYLTFTLMFGGATLSIKTASLMGYLVGLAGRPRDRDVTSARRIMVTAPRAISPSSQYPPSRLRPYR